MIESQTDINMYAKKIIGDTNKVIIGKNNEMPNKDGRYWVAVGPKGINPNFPNDKTIYAEDMKYETLLDVELSDDKGNLYDVGAVVGDVKAHTYPNGIFQTGMAFPNGTDKHPENNDGSIIEFMGKASTENLGKDRVIKVVF